jgi:hypothetical protein
MFCSRGYGFASVPDCGYGFASVPGVGRASFHMKGLSHGISIRETDTVSRSQVLSLAGALDVSINLLFE